MQTVPRILRHEIQKRANVPPRRSLHFSSSNLYLVQIRSTTKQSEGARATIRCGVGECNPFSKREHTAVACKVFPAVPLPPSLFLSLYFFLFLSFVLLTCDSRIDGNAESHGLPNITRLMTRRGRRANYSGNALRNLLKHVYKQHQ